MRLSGWRHLALPTSLAEMRILVLLVINEAVVVHLHFSLFDLAAYEKLRGGGSGDPLRLQELRSAALCNIADELVLAVDYPGAQAVVMLLMGSPLAQVLRRGPVFQAISIVLIEVDAAGHDVLSLLEEAFTHHVDHPVISRP